MKLIHCSDFHLDSALGCNFSPAQAKLRNAELCATFGRMVRFAVAEQVDAVLIAGDLFDSSYVSRQTVDYILEKLPPIVQRLRDMSPLSVKDTGYAPCLIGTYLFSDISFFDFTLFFSFILP